MTEELFRGDSYLKSCDATVTDVVAGGVVLDRTVFYPTGGGQPGDAGRLAWDGGEAAIVDTRKDRETGAIVHVLAEGSSLPSAGAAVTAELDWERRYKHMRMHTCLHLLCFLVEGDVTGGSVGAEKGRLDFNLPEVPFTKEELQERLNERIAADASIAVRWVTDEEFDANPDLVRTMSVKPPRGIGKVRLIDVDGIDLQACGGTHLHRTGEIGAVRIGKIENKGKQNRRINLLFDEG